LTLHILMSFAQFEREVIAERTRDKIAATRKRGLFVTGKPILGYDLVAAPPPFTGKRMVVNECEAEIVRELFRAYLEHKSLLKVVKLCEQRGWRTKTWTASSGRVIGGQPFAKPEVSRLLRNALYIGKVPHHDHLYDGEHPAIVDADTFVAVQQQLKVASQAGGSGQATSANPLRGLVRCKACNCSMSLSTVTRKGKKSSSTHRYFLCSNASKRGRAACPCPSLPAKDLEQFVLDQLKPLLTEDGTLAAVVEEARHQLGDAAQRRVDELAALREQLAGQAGCVGKDAAKERERLTRQVRCDFFEFARTHKTILVTNNLPVLREDTEAVWRRLRCVPFNYVVPAEKRDPKLLLKLRAESAGILRWLVRGCQAWRRDGLPTASAITIVTSELRNSAGGVDAFIDEQCVRCEDGFVPSALLACRYETWCKPRGCTPVQARALGAALQKAGCHADRKDGVRGWRGLSLSQSGVGSSSN
jgi:hypothetical protein